MCVTGGGPVCMALAAFVQVLSKRKGFVRIALQTGAKLVPVIGFGENDLYDVEQPGPIRLWLNRWTKCLFGFTLPNPQGTGLFWGECRDSASHKQQRHSVAPAACRWFTNTSSPACFTKFWLPL